MFQYKNRTKHFSFFNEYQTIAPLVIITVVIIKLVHEPLTTTSNNK